MLALFILACFQELGTFGYLIRRRMVYKGGWLEEQAEDRENPIARIVSAALSGARGGANAGRGGIGDAIARVQGEDLRAQQQVLYGPSNGGSRGATPSRNSSPSPNARRSGGGGRRYTSPECARASAQASRSSLSLSDLFDDFKEEMGARRRRPPEADDPNDPHNWSLAQLRAYLISTLPAGRDNAEAKRIIDDGERDYLVRRTCEVMGRVYRPAAASNDDDIELASARGSDLRPRGVVSPRPAAAGAASPPAAGRCSFDTSASPMRSRSLDSSHVPPSSYDESFQRRVFQRERSKRVQRLFPNLYDDDDDTLSNGSGNGVSASDSAKGVSAAAFPDAKSRPSRAAESRRAPPGAQSPSRQGEHSGAGEVDGDQCRSPPPTQPSCSRPSADSGEATPPRSPDGRASAGAPDADARRRRREQYSQDSSRHSRHSRHSRPSSRGEASPAREDEAAQERQRRRDEVHSRAAERRREDEARSRKRREERRARAAARASEAGGDGASGEDVKAAAAKRVEAWSSGKDFFGLLSSLDEFEGLTLSKGIGTSRDLAPGAPLAAIKKAFHRASLSLHPDRLVGLSTERRAECEEIFKQLSTAYEAARDKAQALDA